MPRGRAAPSSEPGEALRRRPPPAFHFARLVPLLAAGGLGSGCIDTDPAVFVDAQIVGPSATVAQETLGTSVAGSFGIHLHLGPRASGPAEVGLGLVSVVDAGQTSTLVDVLAVQATPAFPVTVPVDGDVDVTVTFEAEDNLLAAAAFDALCGAGTVVVSTALDDSLRGGTLSVASEPFAPAGCR